VSRCCGARWPRGGGGVGEAGGAMERPRWPDAGGVSRTGRMQCWSNHERRMQWWSGCVAKMRRWSQPRWLGEEMAIPFFLLRAVEMNGWLPGPVHRPNNQAFGQMETDGHPVHTIIVT
jgi:hypothetical protein